MTDVSWPPPVPGHLGETGSAFWSRIVADYRLGAGELELLEVAAQAFQNQRAAQLVIDEKGLVVDGRFGPIPNPAVKMMRDFGTLLAQVLRQLGISLDEQIEKVQRGGAGRRAEVRRKVSAN
jgi:phage terminase small subunit